MQETRAKMLEAQITDICALDYAARPISGIILTVSSTRVSPDLHNATINVRIVGKLQSKKQKQILTNLRRQFGAALGTKLAVRRVPKIEVLRDFSLEDADKISRLAQS